MSPSLHANWAVLASLWMAMAAKGSGLTIEHEGELQTRGDPFLDSHPSSPTFGTSTPRAVHMFPRLDGAERKAEPVMKPSHIAHGQVSATPIDSARVQTTALEPAWDLLSPVQSVLGQPAPPARRGPASRKYWPPRRSALSRNLPHYKEVEAILHNLPITQEYRPQERTKLVLKWTEDAQDRLPDEVLPTKPSVVWVSMKLGQGEQIPKGLIRTRLSRLIHGTLLQKLPRGEERRDIERELKRRRISEALTKKRWDRQPQIRAKRASLIQQRRREKAEALAQEALATELRRK